MNKPQKTEDTERDRGEDTAEEDARRAAWEAQMRRKYGWLAGANRDPRKSPHRY